MVTSIKPTLRYQMREYLLSGAVFLGVNIFLILLFSGSFYISVSWGKGVVQYNGYGFASAVFLFVFGIVLPRQALRLGVPVGLFPGASGKLRSGGPAAGTGRRRAHQRDPSPERRQRCRL